MKNLKYTALGILIGCLIPYIYHLTHPKPKKAKEEFFDASDTEEN